MQLFIRGTQTHVVELTGSETVNDVKVIFKILALKQENDLLDFRPCLPQTCLYNHRGRLEVLIFDLERRGFVSCTVS